MKQPGQDKIAAGKAEAAAYWAMRLEVPNCTPADRAAFAAWHAESAENARAFGRAQRALALVDQHLGSNELLELGEQMFRASFEAKAWRRRLLRYGSAAAAACCAVGLAALFGLLPGGQTSATAIASTYETAIGERSIVALPDESVVTLNTNSLVLAHFDEHSDVRRMKLARGQAHFQVEKDPRPFEVLAGDRRIVAHGTAFDVRLNAEREVQVTLVEGRVTVDEVVDGGDQPPQTAPAPGPTTTATQLKVGEQLFAKPNEAPTVTEADVQRIVGWREGRLVFRDDPLADVVAEINRYSRSQLLVADERLRQVRISGVFEAGSTTKFIRAVEDIHPIKARRIADDRIALVWHGEAVAASPSAATES